MVAARFLVAGHVQGVFFRASVRNEALRLGLSGYAKNLDDGRVDVLAHGDAAAIEELARWLQHGPPGACVDRLDRSEAHDELADFAGFQIL